MKGIYCYPHNIDTTFLFSSFGVWKNVDGGKSEWMKMNNGLPAIDVTSGTINPDVPNEICIIINSNGVFKTTDGGASWVEKNKGIQSPTSVYDIKRQPQNSNILCVYTTNGIIYRSTDAAETWSCLNPSDTIMLNYGRIFFDPIDTNIVYSIGSKDQFWKSEDGGRTWAIKNKGLYGYYSMCTMAINPKSPNILYVGGLNNGIFKSTNYGEDWFDADSGLGGQIKSIVVHPTNPKVIYSLGGGTTGGSGVWKSTDKGVTWNRKNNGFPNTYPVPILNKIVIDPNNVNTLYTAGAPSISVAPSLGVFKTTDAGNTWIENNNGLTNKGIRAMALNPKNPSTLYALTSSGLFKKVDSSDNWQMVSNMPDTSSAIFLTLDTLTNPATIYVGLKGPSAILKSNDEGKTWSKIIVSLEDTTVICISVAPNNSNIIYVGTEGVNVYKSSNAGKT